MATITFTVDNPVVNVTVTIADADLATVTAFLGAPKGVRAGAQVPPDQALITWFQQELSQAIAQAQATKVVVTPPKAIVANVSTQVQGQVAAVAGPAISI